jgi:predicted alpha/beta superfamily hydrolase
VKILLLILFLTGCTLIAPAPSGNRTEVVATFEIDMREQLAAGKFKPESDLLGVRGSLPPLNWQTSLPAIKIAEGLYKATVDFGLVPIDSQALQYKFKVDRQGYGPSDGWEDGPNRNVTLRSTAVTVARSFNSQGEAIVVRRTGHFEVFEAFASAHVQSRTVQVWLPPQYKTEPKRRFPVLYLHDGQMKFDAAFAGAEWQMDETAQRLITNGEVAPFIMVASHHSAGQRVLDYTPTESLLAAQRLGTTQNQRVGGGAPSYARFLIEELKPMIDARYRTLPDRKHTSVGGASLGGLVSLWLVQNYSETFSGTLVVSPSVWWDDEFAVRDAQSNSHVSPQQTKIWLDMGVHEGVGAIPSARRLRDALVGKVQLNYFEDSEGGHDEASWARRVPAMLKFLYGSDRK